MTGTVSDSPYGRCRSSRALFANRIGSWRKEMGWDGIGMGIRFDGMGWDAMGRIRIKWNGV